MSFSFYVLFILLISHYIWNSLTIKILVCIDFGADFRLFISAFIKIIAFQQKKMNKFLVITYMSLKSTVITINHSVLLFIIIMKALRKRWNTN